MLKQTVGISGSKKRKERLGLRDKNGVVFKQTEDHTNKFFADMAQSDKLMLTLGFFLRHIRLEGGVAHGNKSSGVY